MESQAANDPRSVDKLLDYGFQSTNSPFRERREIISVWTAIY
jgi:hypothetical protein